MNFPGTHGQLKEIFKGAGAPDIQDLSGEYLVDMLTVFPSFKRFSHRKIIYKSDSRILGHNVLFNKTWGHFFIEEDVCRSVESVRVAVINYNRAENIFPVRGIRDHLRCVSDGALYIGRFNYSFSGRLYFLGYFSLEKVMSGRDHPVAAE